MHYFNSLILNFIFIVFSVSIFTAPFYVWYAISNKTFSWAHLRRNEQVGAFFNSKQANYLIFLWAAAEAICWYIIPEFLLLLVIFLKTKNKKALLTYDIAGTLAGTGMGLALAHFTNFNVTAAPYITQGMVEQVHAWYNTLGIYGLAFQPFSGVPYKVFVLGAKGFAFNIALFLIVAVIVRLCRYIIIFVILDGIYPLLHRFITRHYLPIFLLSCLIFSFFLLDIYHSYGPGYAPKIDAAQRVRHYFPFLR